MTLFKNKSKLFYAAIGVAAVAIIVIGLEATNTTHFFHKSPAVSSPSKPITKLPAQAAKDKNPSTQGSTVAKGTATDKNGQLPSGVSNDPSQWTASSSGEVTLKAPIRNAALKSGDTVTGKSSKVPIHYRLIDNQAGVVSQGIINVVDGNFTALINFQSYSNSGRLDIFNIDPNGKEINEVQIPVNF